MTAPTHKLLSPLSIDESKTNPRKHFDAAALAELTESVRKLGVLQPILVRPKGDVFELVCGHRRLRAAKSAGAKMIPAMVQELTDTEVLEVQLVENMERADLHPLEEAAGYHALMAKKHGYTAAKLAERTGRSVKYIYDRVKLLDLTKEAQELFLKDRITAGHAILLARLSPKDQERAIDPEINRQFGTPRGIWQGEHSLFDPDDESRDKYSGLKPVSVRELEAWIDRSIRFDRKSVEPVLFPETAKLIAEATATNLHERRHKIVPITYDHGLSPDLKGDERTICCNSWKRADGKHDSKACEHSVLGVIVIGRDRGQAFDVCTAKEKCKTHWLANIRAKAKRAKEATSGPGSGAPKADKKGPEKWQIQQAKEEAARKRYEAALPHVVEAVVHEIRTAAIEKIQDLVLAHLQEAYSAPDVAKEAATLMPRGESPEQFVRHVAMLVVYPRIEDKYGHEDAAEVCEALGIDLKKLLDEHAPVEKPAPAKKGAKKKSAPGKCRECGCTDDNCEQCVEATGEPCTWVEPDLCSACAPARVPKAKRRKSA